ncbi:MAG: thiamine phosphate synthase [Candidatus Binatus sp.]|uniref:thiamine phosphate synthase n=1 Tax=Candidatus Binatus sp. TaxID=2811406 RepID=UPI0027250B57|nr:thiamine phosphate synthase [Candidatus Binatus sp.]MDO8434336.1 thiamine phosphate synthase [Candidatus Binatus sp.]
MDARPRAGFKLCLITDRRVVKSGNLIAACEEALAAAAEVAPAGAVALQLREKDLEARELYELALRLRAICTRYGALLLVNDRVDVAIAAGADGVQLPFDSIGASMARKLLGPNRLIGSSAHSPPDVSGAAREGADFALFAPVFDPISKPPTTHAWGIDGLAAACRAGAIPVFALGGITPERARELIANPDASARPAGVAAIGSIIGADSPARAIKAMLAALDFSHPAR